MRGGVDSRFKPDGAQLAEPRVADEKDSATAVFENNSAIRLIKAR